MASSRSTLQVDLRPAGPPQRGIGILDVLPVLDRTFDDSSVRVTCDGRDGSVELDEVAPLQTPDEAHGLSIREDVLDAVLNTIGWNVGVLDQELLEGAWSRDLLPVVGGQEDLEGLDVQHGLALGLFPGRRILGGDLAPQLSEVELGRTGSTVGETVGTTTEQKIHEHA